MYGVKQHKHQSLIILDDVLNFCETKRFHIFNLLLKTETNGVPNIF